MTVTDLDRASPLPSCSADADRLLELRRPAAQRQAVLVASVVACFVCIDQISKAWAWRHSGNAFIDFGGGTVAPSGVGKWFQDRRLGALLDLLDALLLGGVTWLLVSRRRSVAVLASAALAVAGWTSNLADRLGLHYLTAPSSVRGVVDFLPLGGATWNIADFVIIVGTAAFLVSHVAHRLLPARAAVSPLPRPQANRRSRVLVAGAFLTLVALTVAGALWPGRLFAPTMELASSR